MTKWIQERTNRGREISQREGRKGSMGERNDTIKNKENDWESTKEERSDGNKDAKGIKEMDEKMNDFSLCL
jgi:hypothetical protein